MENISQRLLYIFSAVFIALAAHPPSNALAATIRVVKPDALDEFMNQGVTRVFVDGIIDESTPRQLEITLKSLGNGQWVFLNSPGGSLFAGMEAGRVLRKFSSTTYVGEYGFKGKQGGGTRVYEIKPGRCESACAFVFMGGLFRFMYSEESKFGVHRFWSTAGTASSDLDRGQIITAAIANYLSEMQINTEAISQLVSAGKNEMNYLNRDLLEKLNITNNGRAPAQWTIDIEKGVDPYLLGQQDVISGGGRLLMQCDSGATFIAALAKVGIENAKMIVREKFTPYLMARLSKSSSPILLHEIDSSTLEADKDNVRVVFYTAGVGKFIDRFDAIGVGFIKPDRPDVYIGFVVDIGKVENRARIKRFLSNCS